MTRPAHRVRRSALARRAGEAIIASLMHLAVPKGPQPYRRPADGRVGRNDPCPCGSGRKSKRCCGAARVQGRFW